MADGVLLVDKAQGLSSHDVVARARRLLGTRQIGHAGTLDPMATGLLVLLVGEATKLSAHLTAEHKRYETEVALGACTDSLDADGRVIAEAPVPDALRAELALGERSSVLQQILAAELARAEQVPPAVSAIHVDGERAYERARRGEAVQLAPRPVAVRSLRLVRSDAEPPLPRLTFELEVSKGYYVRSFGRDVGEALGLPAHLTRLRRLASGAFDVADAAPLLDRPPALLPLAEAVRRALPCAALTERGAQRAVRGQPLDADDFVADAPGALAAWFEGERLVALGEPREGRWRVVRGFAQAAG